MACKPTETCLNRSQASKKIAKELNLRGDLTEKNSFLVISKYLALFELFENKYDAESFSVKLQCAAPDSIMGKISFSGSPVLEL